jgi:hypothetical protein
VRIGRDDERDQGDQAARARTTSAMGHIDHDPRRLFTYLVHFYGAYLPISVHQIREKWA